MRARCWTILASSQCIASGVLANSLVELLLIALFCSAIYLCMSLAFFSAGMLLRSATQQRLLTLLPVVVMSSVRLQCHLQGDLY